jgi:hypothetical protein
MTVQVRPRPLISVGQPELALGADQLLDPGALERPVRGIGDRLRAKDARVAPLSAHLAAQVAEVRHAQLHEGGHREILGARRSEVLQDGPPPLPHPAQVPAREPRERDPAAEAHWLTLL